MDTRIRKWIRWLEISHDEIQQLLIAKDIFWSVQVLIRNNEDIQKPSAFYQYLGDTYISHVVIGIRRQVKVSDQSVSFLRLLKEVAEDPGRITRKYYKGLYVGSVVEDLADSDFDRFCEKSCAEHVSETLIKQDIVELKNLSKVCEGFADKRIAHRDKRGPKVLPKFHEVYDVITKLDELYVKYHLLFHASCMDTLMPTYQYDWEAVFDFPWRVSEKI